MSQCPHSRKITFTNLTTALLIGIQRFKQTLWLSLGYSSLFTLIGFGLYMLLEAGKIAPISHSLAAGFVLMGPALLVGFFSISDAVEQQRRPAVSDIIKGFCHSNLGLWGFSILCMFLFIIWITEAATIYAFIVGAEPVGFMEMLPPDDNVTGFLLFSSAGGLLLALITFIASAFTVPLMIYTDTSMVQAIVASTRAVFRNYIVMMAWAMLLLILIMGAAWFLPLLPLTLPVAAYASLVLYRTVFVEE
jgi:uncharacterized membrane protein